MPSSLHLIARVLWRFGRMSTSVASNPLARVKENWGKSKFDEQMRVEKESTVYLATWASAYPRSCLITQHSIDTDIGKVQLYRESSLSLAAMNIHCKELDAMWDLHNRSGLFDKVGYCLPSTLVQSMEVHSNKGLVYNEIACVTCDTKPERELSRPEKHGTNIHGEREVKSKETRNSLQ